MNSRILVVSPHPDDETLGAGGTILRYKSKGKPVYWLNFTNMLEEYGYSRKEVTQRQNEIERVIGYYDFDGFFDLHLEPAGLDKYPRKELIAQTASIMKEIFADTVILPFRNDVHSDHRITFEVLLSCTKIFRYPSIKKILMMEVLSETDFSCFDREFSPNYFVDISGFIEKKLEILKVYQNQLEPHPFPRSVEHIKALALHRGVAAGCRYAEGFILLKEVEN